MTDGAFHKLKTLPDLTGREPPPTLPTRIGPYRPLSPIGHGGMGYLYLAAPLEGGPPVTLKLLPFEGDEFTALSHVRHPHIATPISHGKWEKGSWIALEYIPGLSLRTLIEKRAINSRFALELLIQTASALACLHDAGLIHGDLKPENLLVTERGDIKLIDFGLSRKANKEMKGRFGTPAYLAPEVRDNPSAASPASDLYSLALIAAEMMSGALPKAVEQCLHADPKQRFQSATEFLAHLTPPPELRSTFPKKGPGWPQIEIGLSGPDTPTGVYLDFFRLPDGRLGVIWAEPALNIRPLVQGMMPFIYPAVKKGCHPKELAEALQSALKEGVDQTSIALLFLVPERDQLLYLGAGATSIWHLPDGALHPHRLETPNQPLGPGGPVSFLELAESWKGGDQLFLTSPRSAPTGATFSENRLLAPQAQAEAIARTLAPYPIAVLQRIF